MDDLSQYLEVDRHELDTQLAQQPELYYKVAVEAAESHRTEMRAEGKLSSIRRQLENRIRAAAVRAEEKITQAALDSQVKTKTAYKKALSAYRDAQLDVALCEARKEAFRQRGFSLRELVNLYCAEYYSNLPAKDEAPRSNRRTKLTKRNNGN